MNYLKLSILVFIGNVAMVSPSLNAQVIEKINSRLYKHDGQVYKYKHMDNIFVQQEDAHRHFLKARKNLDISKTLAIMSLTSGVIGLFLIAKSIGETLGNAFTGNRTVGSEAIAGGILLGIIAPTTGITALVLFANGKKHKKQSLKVFNQAYGIKLPEDNPIDLHLVIGNGLGVKFTF